MKRGLLTLSLLLPLAAYAQSSYAQRELKQALDTQQAPAAQRVQVVPSAQVVQVRPDQTANLDDTQYPLKATAAPADSSTSNQGSITFNSNVYQQQPNTVVEENPVTVSNADQMRKKRQNVEEQTESRIVEKLEVERMKAEELRAKKILGTIESTTPVDTTATQVVQPQPQAPAPVAVQVVQPQAPVVVAPPPAPLVESADAKSSEKIEDADVKEEKPRSRFYVGALGGIGDYPSVKNIHGDYALGVLVGTELPERILIEGAFTYSKFDMDYDRYAAMAFSGSQYNLVTGLNQYGFSGGARYQILDGTVRPTVGALLAYTYRKYQTSSYGYGTVNSDNTSSAFDAGLSAGLDFYLSQRFSLGLDFRYMFNLGYRANNTNYYQPVYNYQDPLETRDYYTLGVTGRATF